MDADDGVGARGTLTAEVEAGADLVVRAVDVHKEAFRSPRSAERGELRRQAW